MDLIKLTSSRYTTKAYDPTRRATDEQINDLITLLHQAPSSVNSQPWHFLVAGDEASKARVAKSTEAGFAVNTAKVTQASHVFVLAARTNLDDAYLNQLLEAEAAAGRFPTDEARAGQAKGRGFYVGMHRETLKDVPLWTEKQVYLALGTLLLGAAAVGLDATPMEGFNREVLDAELGLTEKGLASVVLVSVGYRSEADFNAKLPKARLPLDQVVTRL